jgi:hypothetical protein
MKQFIMAVLWICTSAYHELKLQSADVCMKVGVLPETERN